MHIDTLSTASIRLAHSTQLQMKAARLVRHSLTCPSSRFPQISRRFIQKSTRLYKNNAEKKEKVLQPPPSTNIDSTRRSERQQFSGQDLPRFTEQELEALEDKYTPDQIAAIKAGEEAIDPQDIADQAILQKSPMSLDYIDDFAEIRPISDKQPKAPKENYDPNLRFKTRREIAGDLGDWLLNLPDNPDRVEWRKFLDETRLTVGKAEAERNPASSEAPQLKKIDDPIIRAQARASKAAQSEDEEMAEHYERLSRRTGIPVDEMRELRFKTLVYKRVVNQTRLGKISSIYYLTVTGNGKGLLGLGEGKANEPRDAKRQSVLNAIRNLQPIPRYEARTIFGDVKGKVGATELELFTRPPGKKPFTPPHRYVAILTS